MVHQPGRELVDKCCPGKWLKTPLGWTRAQIIYEKLSGPPRYGTLLEAMCILVHRYLQHLEFLGVRAQAQAALGGDAAESAFKEFHSFLSRVEVEDTTKKMKERLEDLKKIKEIRFQPIVSTEKKLNVPRVSRDSIKESGVLDHQLRTTKSRSRKRPIRARKPKR